MPQENTLTVMTDLTTRLRASAALYTEAADEIERLRTEFLIANELVLWPACAVQLQRVLASFDRALS